MVTIAVDLGRSLTKVLAGTGPEPEVRFGFLPVLSTSWTDVVLYAGPSDLPFLRGRLGDRLFEVGLSGELVDLSPRKASQETALVLAAAVALGLHALGLPPGPVEVITGVPPAFLGDAEKLARQVHALTARSAGLEFLFGDGSVVRLSEWPMTVTVLAEGDGLFVHYLRSTAERPVSAVVLDLGHATTSVVWYQAGHRMAWRTEPFGGKDVFEALLDRYLNPGWGPFYAQDLPRLFHLLAEGRPLRLLSPVAPPPEPGEIQARLREEAARVWQGLAVRLRSWLSARAPDAVIAGGGGVWLFPVGELIAGAYIPPDPRYAQVLGYYAYRTVLGEGEGLARRVREAGANR